MMQYLAAKLINNDIIIADATEHFLDYKAPTYYFNKVISIM